MTALDQQQGKPTNKGHESLSRSPGDVRVMGSTRKRVTLTSALIVFGVLATVGTSWHHAYHHSPQDTEQSRLGSVVIDGEWIWYLRRHDYYGGVTMIVFDTNWARREAFAWEPNVNRGSSTDNPFDTAHGWLEVIRAEREGVVMASGWPIRSMYYVRKEENAPTEVNIYGGLIVPGKRYETLLHQPPVALPMRIVFGGFLLNTLFFASWGLVPVAFWAGAGWFKRSRRRTLGRCENCGYDLKLIQSEKCPECGTSP